MLKGFVEFIASGLTSCRPPKQFVHRDIYGRVVEHAEEFFHPVKFRGIPVFDADSILVHYKPQLDKLREVVDIGDHRKTPDGKSMFDELFTNIIKRYITFAHMIPASEDHHHSHTGGLLTHSIEASIEALRWSKELKCQVTHMPDLDAKIKPIMDYAAWLGTLLHDVGKIMRDISVDAVEVIHPLTKRPIPISNPIVSWHPQKQSLTEWAKLNNISAYSVTWLRHRTHNRHNIDSGQLLQPLLHGTYALDYLLSSPIKQELYSELVRCLSGYTHQKGHISDCMRMGDSVSTNKSLAIQYDRVRGTRNISTATKIYQCINHARKSWDWNRPKSEGWVIGNTVYIRWSSAIDSIVTASNELQYGLPTDTRNIITIMEQNGFTHLFDPECPNDRILKFTPGNFNEKQAAAIVNGQQPVTWLDLIKVITPQIVFGENPMPPSMSGIVYLPNSKFFFLVNKDGDIAPLQAPSQPAVQNTKEIEASSQNTMLAPSQSEQPLDVTPPTSKQTQKSKAKQKADAKQPQPQKPAFTPSLPKPASKNAAFDTSSIIQLPQAASHEDAISHSVVPEPSNSNSDNTSLVIRSGEQYPLSNLETTSEQAYQSSTSINEINQDPISNGDKDIPAQDEDESLPEVIIPKSMKPSSTYQAILDKRVIFYKTKRDILIDCSDAESKLEMPLSDILRELKSANELLINPMTPSILTVFHTDNGQKVKCMALSFQLSRLYSKFPEGKHNAESDNSTPIQDGTEDTSENSLKENSVEQAIQPVKSKPSNKEKGANKSKTDKPAHDTEPSSSEAPIIPAKDVTAISITEPFLRQFITKQTAYRSNGNVYLNLDLLTEATSLSLDDVFTQLKLLGAPHICPLEPTPTITKQNRNKKTINVVKLSESYATLLPLRKPEHQQSTPPEIDKPEEKTPEPPKDDHAISLSNLAAGAGEKSLLHFLVSLKADGLLTYLPDGNIALNLSASPSFTYKPYGKTKIVNHLINIAGGKRSGLNITLSQSALSSIQLEDIK